MKNILNLARRSGRIFLWAGISLALMAWALAEPAAATNSAGDPLPTVVVFTSDPIAAESSPHGTVTNTASFALFRVGRFDTALTVNYELGGTASNGVDYARLPGSITLAPGTLMTNVWVRPLDDERTETNETVVLALKPDAHYRVGFPSNASVTLLDNDPATNLPPTVSFFEPLPGQVFIASANIPLVAKATAQNGGWIATVEFFEGTHRLGITTNNPLEFNPLNPFMLAWTNVPPGHYALTARATDDRGVSTVSAPVPITVLRGTSQISITSPTNNARFVAPATIVINATTIDPHGYISRAEFFDGAHKIGTAEIVFIRAPDPGTPIHLSFEWKAVPAGNYTLTAAAQDTLGQTIFSAPVHITVSHPTALPVVTVVATDPVADEGFFMQGDQGAMNLATNTGTFTLSRTGSTNSPLTVRYALGGTASNGVDYVRLADSVTIRSGARSAEIRVVPLEDERVETNETVVLTLKPGDLYQAGSPSHALITIVDNDHLTNQPPRSFAERQLPETYTPGVKLTVKLQAAPPAGTAAYALEDQPPGGWTVSAISHEGTFDSVTRKVKFGPFFDSTVRTLTYDLTPPPGTTGTKEFVGTASADGINSPIGGPRTIRRLEIVPHPADNNPVNFVLSLNELTAYAAAWKKGLHWPIEPNPIPIGYVTRAATLWKVGEVYRFDPSAGPAPLWWVSTNQAGPHAGVNPQAAIGLMSLSENSAVSDLPATYLPGAPFTVTIIVTPASDIITYAVEDQPPAGWTVASINEGGQWDGINHKVKWLFLDDTPRTLNYQVTPPPNASGAVTFVGVASFDGPLGGPEAAITGQRQSQRAEPDARAKLVSLTWLEQGELRLTLTGTPGQTYTIEASTNLIDWVALGEVTPTNSPFQFLDATASDSGHRFYRARAAGALSVQQSSVRISAPENGTVLDMPAGVTLVAEVAPGDRILSKVEFYQGSTKLGETTQPPHTLTVPGVPVGCYAYTAKASFESGGSILSSPVTVMDRRVHCAIGALARFLNRPRSEIRPLGITPAHWGDASLGCPEPGMYYAQVLTSGYIITLAAGRNLYEIHTGLAGQHFVLCLPADPAAPFGFTQGKSLGGCAD